MLKYELIKTLQQHSKIKNLYCLLPLGMGVPHLNPSISNTYQFLLHLLHSVSRAQNLPAVVSKTRHQGSVHVDGLILDYSTRKIQSTKR